ncbi:MAG: CDP-alcohol phosphatidyltransferase family protein [Halobacteriales archaeon]
MSLFDRARELGYGGVDPVVDAAVERGVTANQVTVASFSAAVAAAACIGYAEPASLALAVALLVVSGSLDMVDGEVARRTDTASKQGDLLDHGLDRYADAVLVLGVAAAVDAWLLGTLALAGVLLTAYVGTQAQAVGVGRVYRGVLTRASFFGLTGVGAALAAFEVKLFDPEAVEVGADVAVASEPLGAVLVYVGFAGLLTSLQRSWVVWNRLPSE